MNFHLVKIALESILIGKSKVKASKKLKRPAVIESLVYEGITDIANKEQIAITAIVKRSKISSIFPCVEEISIFSVFEVEITVFCYCIKVPSF